MRIRYVILVIDVCSFSMEKWKLVEKRKFNTAKWSRYCFQREREFKYILLTEENFRFPILFSRVKFKTTYIRTIYRRDSLKIILCGVKSLKFVYP